MALVYKSDLVFQLREEMKREGMNPDSFLFRFDGVTLTFKNALLNETIKPQLKVEHNYIKRPYNSLNTLKKLMKEKNITNTKMSQVIGCSESKISLILNKKNEIKKSDLKLMIDFCIGAQQDKYGPKKKVPSQSFLNSREESLTQKNGELVPKHEIELLRALIKTSELSLRDICSLTNSTEAGVYAWLSGTNRPRRRAFDRLMSAFNESDIKKTQVQ